nr:protein DOG1-like 3 [Tanacetum cinerariifolium]
MVDLSSTASEILRKNKDGDEEIKENVQTLNSLLGSKEDKLEEVLHMADGLRMETLKSVVEILTPLQAVRFLIAAAELHLRLHDYEVFGGSLSREKDVVSVSPYGPDGSLDYRIKNIREFIFKWSVVRQMNQIM